MRLLLDSHSFLWSVFGRHHLTRRGLTLLEDEGNHLLLSSASIWELSIKVAKGKLPMPGGSVQYLLDQAATIGLELLPIRPAHILRTETLPHLHRDPFDRMIVAQALVEQLPILSADAMFARYGATVLWR